MKLDSYGQFVIMNRDVRKDGFEFIEAVGRHQPGAEVFDMGKAFQVVGIMPAHFKNAQLFAFPLYRAPAGACGRHRDVLQG